MFQYRTFLRTGIPGLDICRKHANEPVSNYCVTCEAPCCPLCFAADHPEPDHSGIDLDTAVQERLQKMKGLTQECTELKGQVESSFAQGETVLNDLDSCIETIMEDMNRAEENARRDFERRLQLCRENSMKRVKQLKEQRVQIIHGHMESLKKDRDRLSNAIRVAHQVTNSATKHEVALTYGTLSGKMQKLKTISPPTISKALSKLAFRQHDTCPDMFKAEDLGNVLTRPGTRGKVSFSKCTKPPNEGFDAAVLARHGIRLDVPGRPSPNNNAPTAANSDKKTEDEVLKDAPNHVNIVIPTPKPKAKDGALETLELACEFGREGDGKVQHARGVAVSSVTNDIAVADYDTRQLKIYTSHGEFRFAVETKQGNKWDEDSKPWDVAVSSEGEYMVTDKTPYVKVYDAEGKSKGRFPAFSPDKQRSDVDDVGLYCIATDSNGRILVGAGNFYISIHSAAREGCHVNSISVRLPPGFMATTSQGYIVIGSWSQQKVMILDQNGEVFHTLKPPTGMTSWRPRGVCCSQDDEVYVANQVAGKSPGKSGIHRYDLFTGEHIGCVTNDIKAPLGIAMLYKPDNGLVMAEKTTVKIFNWTDKDDDDDDEEEDGGSGGNN